MKNVYDELADLLRGQNEAVRQRLGVTTYHTNPVDSAYLVQTTGETSGMYYNFDTKKILVQNPENLGARLGHPGMSADAAEHILGAHELGHAAQGAEHIGWERAEARFTAAASFSGKYNPESPEGLYRSVRSVARNLSLEQNAWERAESLTPALRDNPTWQSLRKNALSTYEKSLESLNPHGWVRTLEEELEGLTPEDLADIPKEVIEAQRQTISDLSSSPQYKQHQKIYERAKAKGLSGVRTPYTAPDTAPVVEKGGLFSRLKSRFSAGAIGPTGKHETLSRLDAAYDITIKAWGEAVQQNGGVVPIDSEMTPKLKRLWEEMYGNREAYVKALDLDVARISNVDEDFVQGMLGSRKIQLSSRTLLVHSNLSDFDIDSVNAREGFKFTDLDLIDRLYMDEEGVLHSLSATEAGGVRPVLLKGCVAAEAGGKAGFLDVQNSVFLPARMAGHQPSRSIEEIVVPRSGALELSPVGERILSEASAGTPFSATPKTPTEIPKASIPETPKAAIPETPKTTKGARPTPISPTGEAPKASVTETPSTQHKPKASTPPPPKPPPPKIPTAAAAPEPHGRGEFKLNITANQMKGIGIAAGAALVGYGIYRGATKDRRSQGRGKVAIGAGVHSGAAHLGKPGRGSRGDTFSSHESGFGTAALAAGASTGAYFGARSAMKAMRARALVDTSGKKSVTAFLGAFDKARKANPVLAKLATGRGLGLVAALATFPIAHRLVQKLITEWKHGQVKTQVMPYYPAAKNDNTGQIERGDSSTQGHVQRSSVDLRTTGYVSTKYDVSRALKGVR